MKAATPKMTDDELVKQCLNNNQGAQKELFVRFSSTMLGVCLRYTSSKSDAEDVLQEAFIKVFNKLDKYSGLGSFEGWIRRIVVNTALDYLRKNKKMQLNSSIDDVGYGIKKDHFIVEDLTAKESWLLGLLTTDNKESYCAWQHNCIKRARYKKSLLIRIKN